MDSVALGAKRPNASTAYGSKTIGAGSGTTKRLLSSDTLRFTLEAGDADLGRVGCALVTGGYRWRDDGWVDQYWALSDLGDRDVSGILGNITVLVKSKVLMWDHAMI